MTLRNRPLVALVCLSLTATVEADDDFSSDRPGFANGTQAAPVLRPITELGAALAWDPNTGTTGRLPDLRVRVGAAPWLELRVDAPSLLLADPLGIGDLTLGLKLASPVGASLAVSIVPSVTVPSGTGGGVVTGRLEINWSANAGILGFGGNFAAGSVLVLDERRVQGEGSLALSVQPTATFSAYVQSYALWIDGEHPDLYVGAGVAVMAHPRVQIDAYADVGVTNGTTRLQLGVGTSVLWGRST